MLGWTPLQRNLVKTIRALVPKSQTGCHHCHSVPLVRRTYATSKFHGEVHSEATNVAVLGGGITGLASAYYLAQQLPHSQITLFEGSLRLGGWLRSKQVDVGNGKVVFEQGPRNLRPTRPNGWVTLDLVSLHGMERYQQLISMLRSKAWGWRIKS